MQENLKHCPSFLHLPLVAGWLWQGASAIPFHSDTGNQDHHPLCTAITLQSMLSLSVPRMSAGSCQRLFVCTWGGGAAESLPSSHFQLEKLGPGKETPRGGTSTSGKVEMDSEGFTAGRVQLKGGLVLVLGHSECQNLLSEVARGALGLTVPCRREPSPPSPLLECAGEGVSPASELCISFQTV